MTNVYNVSDLHGKRKQRAGTKQNASYLEATFIHPWPTVDEHLAHRRRAAFSLRRHVMDTLINRKET
ncbi:hypothetical protein DPMN_152138 [Dreissena polymorpha]|uniref:Uncharacterized protein n=1 Tax=Dreissena polymorpha TaxID=45954 RepID=A0A9D4FJV0_DREPO|nr:hypothetical protein DPMN_152138 [Dreissena polymorpha]